MKILLIEDDKAVASAITSMLKSQRIICDHDVNGQDGFDSARLYEYDAIILDMILPDLKGEELLSRMRACEIKTPVIILSSISETSQKVKALCNGADDYLPKPFDKQELLARLNAVIRRSNGHSASVIKIGTFVIDLQRKCVSISDKNLMLTKTEYNILELLARRKDSFLHKDSFLDHLYNADCNEPGKKIVDVFMCKLRKKISKALGNSELNDNSPAIATSWGNGYRLDQRKNLIDYLPKKKMIRDNFENSAEQKIISEQDEFGRPTKKIKRPISG
ncbi:response regulator transcription factor [Candidatus Cytomitobacter indipagum]|uniref:Response regulator transcription factor n=1 Tax=Candidatus Cytomitobacter indipagum TaxID=2601575 RepID=A0A5C0UF86_9PROT|nr:response regulator transcription factor [Candidatus Cytomitobacter indipagum]QEK37922.1 response regulator transcription factor [Candidatus Cytomitobacter indipagum]